MDLSIRPIPTSKDKIKQPFLAEANVIPKINTSSLFIGASGSGKTTLVANLLTRADMLKNVFDRTFLISPTAKTDDIQKFLKLPEDDIIDELKDAASFLSEIMAEQVIEIEEKGAHKAPKYLVIYDDVISNPEFLKTDEFVRSFVMNRHFNFTTFICSQSYKGIPRKCRLQARHIFYFKGSESENETIMEDRSPPNFSKNMGLELVEAATKDKYSFLHIHMGVDMVDRYRRNLRDIIDISISHNSNDGNIRTNKTARADTRRRGQGKRILCTTHKNNTIVAPTTPDKRRKCEAGGGAIDQSGQHCGGGVG
jgi:hypothetical protein